MKEIKFYQECASCHGTGLYKGMCEGDGAAVVCSRCNGTGRFYFTHQYEEFTGKKVLPGVRRVFEAACGMCIGENEEKGIHLEDFGGIPYGDWLNGSGFPDGSEMRKFTCPAQWHQSARNASLNWDECEFGYFRDCKKYKTKHLCWAKYDNRTEGD